MLTFLINFVIVYLLIGGLLAFVLKNGTEEAIKKESVNTLPTVAQYNRLVRSALLDILFLWPTIILGAIGKSAAYKRLITLLGG